MPQEQSGSGYMPQFDAVFRVLDAINVKSKAALVICLKLMPFISGLYGA